jgi:hypothetical protein
MGLQVGGLEGAAIAGDCIKRPFWNKPNHTAGRWAMRNRIGKLPVP